MGSKEDIHRWELVTLLDRLGASDDVDRAELALLDLETTASCADKKRAIGKITELGVKDAIAKLEALKIDPKFKCVQASAQAALDRLRKP